MISIHQNIQNKTSNKILIFASWEDLLDCVSKSMTMICTHAYCTY